MKFLSHKKDKKLGIAEGKRRYDLPLASDAGTGFLVLLIALMTFLAVLALGVSFTLGSMTARWSSGLENKVTIEIPMEKSDGGMRTKSDIAYLKDEISKRLANDPNIKRLEIMEDRAVQDLLSPWLGDEAVLDNIPLPGLISAELNISDPDITNKLRTTLKAINPDLHLDTHENWLGDLLRMAGALQLAAGFVALIIGLTTITAIAGAMRSRMAVHAEDVQLLHLMGASDEYITRQFQRHALILSLQGAVAGGLAGAVVLLLIGLVSGDAAAALVPDFTMGPAHIGIFLFLPLAVCAVATITARFTVLRVLSTMP